MKLVPTIANPFLTNVNVKLDIFRIAVRIAWTPPKTDSGDTLTLLEYAGPVGPEEEIIKQNGQEYVIRRPIQEPSNPGDW